VHHTPGPARKISRALTRINAVGVAGVDTAAVIVNKRRTLVNTLQRNFTMLVVALSGVMVFLVVLAMSLAGEI
jgi:hypothetical protein